MVVWQYVVVTPICAIATILGGGFNVKTLEKAFSCNSFRCGHATCFKWHKHLGLEKAGTCHLSLFSSSWRIRPDVACAISLCINDLATSFVCCPIMVAIVWLDR